MSKEFHVFTHMDSNYEQAFIFEVERHEQDKLIEFKDLLMVTVTKNGELRTRVKFDNMIESIINTEGGNIPDSKVNTIVEMFSDLLPTEKQMEIIEEFNFRETVNLDPNELIKASDYAIMVEKSEEVNETNTGTTPKI